MATRGRPAFQPTNEQRVNVEVMVGLGIPEEDICLIVRDRRDKPICRTTLRRHFADRRDQVECQGRPFYGRDNSRHPTPRWRHADQG